MASRLCAGGARAAADRAIDRRHAEDGHEDRGSSRSPARMLKGFDDPVAPSTLEETGSTRVEGSGRDDDPASSGRADVLAGVRATWAVTPGRDRS